MKGGVRAIHEDKSTFDNAFTRRQLYSPASAKNVVCAMQMRSNNLQSDLQDMVGMPWFTMFLSLCAMQAAAACYKAARLLPAFWRSCHEELPIGQGWKQRQPFGKSHPASVTTLANLHTHIYIHMYLFMCFF